MRASTAKSGTSWSQRDTHNEETSERKKRERSMPTNQQSVKSIISEIVDDYGIPKTDEDVKIMALVIQGRLTSRR